MKGIVGKIFQVVFVTGGVLLTIWVGLKIPYVKNIIATALKVA